MCCNVARMLCLLHLRLVQDCDEEFEHLTKVSNFWEANMHICKQKHARTWMQ
jgi:hypothetical protein